MSGAWRIVARQTGGPEVLEREDYDPGSPGAGQARVRNTAIGLNFIDTYHRSGLYPLPLPTGIGSEFVGVVEAVGTGVKGLSAGDRIAGSISTGGSYATHVLADVNRVFPLPDSISDEVAAASTLKGLTAWMLIERCAKLKQGQSVLIHASAGGVGSILVPWAKAIGATVIAHAGNPTKADRARQAGADHALSGDFGSLAEQVRELTGGRGVDVILDGVGAASWDASLASIARRGLLVSYGNASGPVPPVAPLSLTRAGSIFLTRPTMFDYLETAEERAEGSKRLFKLINDGTIQIEIGRRFALADAADAHRALEGRETVGSSILIP